MRRLELEQRLDLLAADELAEALEHLRDTPLEIVASGVVHVGGLCLQILLAARLQWSLDGIALRVVQPSDAFVAGLKRLGASMSHFGEDEDDAAYPSG